MSGQLAAIPESPTNYGPLLSSLEESKFRKKFKLLSKLPLPVHFLAPEQVYTEQNLYKGLTLLGEDIEKYLIDLDVESIKTNTNVYIFCINIHCEVVSEVTKEAFNCRYTWDLFTFNPQHDHGAYILDLQGNVFISLTRLLEAIRSD